MDGDLQAEGIDPAELSDSASETTFEVDYDATASPAAGDAPAGESAPDAGAAPPAPAPTSEAAPDQGTIEARLASAERQNQELRGFLQPLLDHFRQQNLPQKPQITFEQLAQDATLGPDKWADAFKTYIDQQLAGVQGQIQSTARQAASQQRARGLFSTEAMGAGRDFDSLYNRFLSPAYSEAPWIRDVLFSKTEDPALAEYALARVFELMERAKGDPVKAFRDLDNALTARVAGAQEALDKITKAQAGAATRVMRATESGPQPISKRVKDAWELGDKDFDSLVEQTGGF